MAAHNATTGNPGSHSWRPGILLRGAPAADRGQAAVGKSFNVYRKPSIGLKLLLLLLVIFAAVLIGGGLAMGNKYIAFGLLGMIGGALVLVTPVIVTFWLIILLAFLITGPITYFLHISQFQWLAPALDATEYVQVLLLILSGRLRGQTTRIPAFAIWLAVYLFCALFTSALSGITLAEAIMASRYNIFVWGALLVFLVGVVQDTTIDQIWKLLLGIAWLQLPMALYQYKFVASKRASGDVLSEAPPWDAIIGTFPGTDTAGGNSAAMAIYLLVMIVLTVALWREGRMRGIAAGGLVVSGLATLALAEVKAVVLLIPVALALYYYKDVLRRPIETLFALMLSCALALGLLYGYQKIHYDGIVLPVAAENYDATVWDRIMNQLSPDNVKEANDRLGRVALLIHWWDNNPRAGDVQHTLFGHGLGTTQVSRIGVGSTYKRWGDVGRTSLTILLWETGLLGTFAFMMMLATSAYLSSQMAREARIPDTHRIYLRVGAIGLLLFLLTLAYKPFAVRLFPTMMLMIIMMGQAHYWSNRLANEDHRKRLARLAGTR
jgi:hypothetical protein